MWVSRAFWKKCPDCGAAASWADQRVLQTRQLLWAACVPPEKAAEADLGIPHAGQEEVVTGEAGGGGRVGLALAAERDSFPCSDDPAMNSWEEPTADILNLMKTHLRRV